VKAIEDQNNQIAYKQAQISHRCRKMEEKRVREDPREWAAIVAASDVARPTYGHHRSGSRVSSSAHAHRRSQASVGGAYANGTQSINGGDGASGGVSGNGVRARNGHVDPIGRANGTNGGQGFDRSRAGARARDVPDDAPGSSIGADVASRTAAQGSVDEDADELMDD
jgi:hypothetical protein